MRRTLVLPAALLLLPALAACGDDATPEVGEDATVEVSDAGSGDTVRFQLDVAEGHVERQTIAFTQTLDAGMQRITLPELTMEQVTEVTGVSEDGIDATQTIEGITVGEGGDPTARSAIEAAVAPLEGVAGVITYDVAGAITSAEFDVPDDVDAQARQVIEQLSDQAAQTAIVYPEEEIGEGATWTARSTLELNGIEVEQTIDYTLTSLDGDQYVIEVEMEQEYREGEVDGVEFDGGSGTGSGTYSGTVGTLVPAEADVQFSNSIEAQGQTVATDTDMQMTSTVE